MATNVTTINFPVAQLFHLCILGWHDTNGDLRRLAQVRAVERNRRNRPTSEPLPRFLAQAFEGSIFHHIAHLATVSFTIDPFDPPGWREIIPFPCREQSRREADTPASSDLSNSRWTSYLRHKKQTFLGPDNWHGRVQVLDCVWINPPGECLHVGRAARWLADHL